MDKKTLLIADDDEMNRMIIRKFLQEDFTILEAENGKTALKLLREKKVDLLLLDIIMPEMDGLEVLQCMKEDSLMREIGVLVATSTKEKTERTALSYGADDIVSKPYDPIVIRKRAQNILAKKEIQDAGHRIIKLVEDVSARIEDERYVQECIEEIRRQAEQLEAI